MSRESDSSSSGLQGRGNAAYPSGTPPYGTPRGAAEGAAAPGGAAEPDEPKTETTLTTRIKINIPGSRPIPPVVVRKPVGEESGMNGSADSRGSGGKPGPLPRRPDRTERTGSVPRPEAPADGAPQGGAGEKTSDWFAPRKGAAGSSGGSSTTGSHPVPPAPGASSTTGSHPAPPVPGAPAAPRGSGATPPPRPDLPYFSDGREPRGAAPLDDGQDPLGGSPLDGGRASQGASPFDAGNPAPRGGSPFDGTAPRGGSPFDGSAGPGPDLSPFDAPADRGPSGPTTGPAPGSGPLNLPPGFSDPGTGDDTAQLTPQPPAPPLAGPGSGVGAGGGIAGGVPGGPAPKGPKGGPGAPDGARDRLSGDTLVSGIPKVPGTDGPAPAAPAPKGKPAGDSAAPAPRPKIPEPINPPKKGRSKIVLAGVGIVVLAGLAYGAGLLLDHADVPNGTTALGVDIGGMAKEDAVKKLEGAVKDRRHEPLKLTVDGKDTPLDPRKAGLDVDVQATVRNAAGREYNPVAVISSLFGGTRAAKPAMVVDDEKLENALQQVAGPAGASEDGGITFENGRAVPHYGKPHKAVDVAASKTEVTDAYRDRVTSDTSTPVVLAAGTQQPKVGKDAVDKALKQFAEPAMSGLITVRTDAAHAVSFSPQKSIPKFLSFKVAEGGTLVPYYDQAALKALYGDTFNGVLLTKGDGTKKPVGPKEVASAVQLALQGKTPAERVQTIGADAG
ncbi:hypothetical protein [Streptomyces pinistramenti]|uniref:hypothetical protein n=1 Tax=Streptomyces pinistramenti TaxID=2884812 RepID=UPI001D0846D4|nr:hypothetical protein [Streptomyces pinistramenti]MCB5909783.1 hypothetical protein [Streptomyces pinistramenti]